MRDGVGDDEWGLVWIGTGRWEKEVRGEWKGCIGAIVVGGRRRVGGRFGGRDWMRGKR